MRYMQEPQGNFRKTVALKTLTDFSGVHVNTSFPFKGTPLDVLKASLKCKEAERTEIEV